MLDLPTLLWLPIAECRGSHLLLAAYKAMYFTNWPLYLKLDVYAHGRSLRPSTETILKVPKTPGTFQDSTSKSLNSLPSIIRNCTSLTEFKSLLLKHLKEKAANRLCWKFNINVINCCKYKFIVIIIIIISLTRISNLFSVIEEKLCSSPKDIPNSCLHRPKHSGTIYPFDTKIVSKNFYMSL